MITEKHMTDPLMKLLLVEAAEEGAKRALASVGLHDENAAEDLRAMRGLLDLYRDAQKTALRVLTGIFVTGVVGLVSANFLVTQLGRLWRGE